MYHISERIDEAINHNIAYPLSSSEHSLHLSIVIHTQQKLRQFRDLKHEYILYKDVNQKLLTLKLSV